MKEKDIGKVFLTWILAGSLMLILFTRGITLGNNRQLHPDEHVFYLGANSLVNALLHPGSEFQEYMEYPEGSYYFYGFFQLAGKVISRLAGVEHDLQLWGRIGAVFYFSAAVALGIRIMAKYLGKTRSAVSVYALTMCFSLFFLEQSRYGVGDMISLMLLMLLINLIAHGMPEGRGKLWLPAAFFVCGVMGAVKYPLLVFLILPAGAWLHCRHLSQGRKWAGLLGQILVCVAGFLLFSPKGMMDPGYFLRVLQREGGAYVTAGTSHEAGGVLNHLTVLLVYSLVYSDFPLLLPATIRNFFWRAGETAEERHSEADFLFRCLLPGTCLLFFGYNLFARSLFFRTYTPFFGIVVLYTSELAGRLLHRKGWKRVLALCLCMLMVLRGGVLVWAMSGVTSASEKVSERIVSALDSNWKETYITSLFSLASLPESADDGTVNTSAGLGSLMNENNGELEIRPGQLVITGAYGYHLGLPYLLPAGEEQEAIRLWQAFREANREYLVGQAYPEWYYILFGCWLRGGTLSQYEFPVDYSYYRK